jgi:hypothetical protein
MEADALLGQFADLLAQVRLVEVPVADEQDGPSALRGQALEQGLGAVERRAHTAPLELGQVRGQGRECVEDREGVFGDWGDHMGDRGEGDQPQANLAVDHDEVLDLLARPGDAARGHVGDLHGAGDVEQDQHVVAGMKEPHVGVVPAWPSHGEQQQGPEQGPLQEPPPALLGLELPGAG